MISRCRATIEPGSGTPNVRDGRDNYGLGGNFVCCTVARVDPLYVGAGAPLPRGATMHTASRSLIPIQDCRTGCQTSGCGVWLPSMFDCCGLCARHVCAGYPSSDLSPVGQP